MTMTDPGDETEKGRVAIWLDPSDLEWLGSFCGCQSDANEAQKKRCGRIRFRANAALHKAGLKEDSK
jgi:hypothetical protein